MQKINFKSDLKIVESYPKTDDFVYHYTTDEKVCYDVSLEIGNCRKAEPECGCGNAKLIICLDNHGLNIGQLKVRREMRYKDDDMPDGIYNKITENKYDIFLVKGASTEVDEIEVDGYLPIFRGEKGDAYEITEDDYEAIAELTAEKVDLSNYYTKKQVDTNFTEKSEFYSVKNDLQYTIQDIKKLDDWGTSIMVVGDTSQVDVNVNKAEASLRFGDNDGSAISPKGSVVVTTDGVEISSMNKGTNVKVNTNTVGGDGKFYYNDKEVAVKDDLEAKQDKLNTYYEEKGGENNSIKMRSDYLELFHANADYTYDSYGTFRINNKGLTMHHEGSEGNESTEVLIKNGEMVINDKKVATIDDFKDFDTTQCETLAWRSFNGGFRGFGFKKTYSTEGPGAKGYDGLAYTAILKETKTETETNYVLKQWFYNVDGSTMERMVDYSVSASGPTMFLPTEWKKIVSNYTGSSGIGVSSNGVISLTQRFKSVNGESVEGEGNIEVKVYEEVKPTDVESGFAIDILKEGTDEKSYFDPFEQYSVTEHTITAEEASRKYYVNTELQPSVSAMFGAISEYNGSSANITIKFEGATCWLNINGNGNGYGVYNVDTDELYDDGGDTYPTDKIYVKFNEGAVLTRNGDPANGEVLYYFADVVEEGFYTVRDGVAKEIALKEDIPEEYDDTEVKQKITELGEDYEYVEGQVSNLKEKVDELQLYKFPNTTIYGQPTINNGQVSDFSEDNYLQMPFVVDFANRPYRIDFNFTTGEDVTTQQNIIDSNYGLAVAVRNSRLVVAVSSNGTSWDGEYVADTVIEAESTYNVSFEYDGATLTVTINDDVKTFDNVGYPYPKQIIIGKGTSGHIFGGSINLNYAKLTISDKVVWSGMDDVGIATRAAVDLSNIDAAGEAKINGMIDEKLGDLEIILKSI